MRRGRDTVAYVSHTIRRAEALQASTIGSGPGRNQVRDPQFDEQQFLARVSQAFLKIQDAWSRQDLSAVRPFISDGIRERFSFQFNMQQGARISQSARQRCCSRAQAAVVVANRNSTRFTSNFRATADDYASTF